MDWSGEQQPLPQTQQSEVDSAFCSFELHPFYGNTAYLPHSNLSTSL